MAAPIKKAVIPRRDRINVTPERRAEARAGMGGELVKSSEGPASPMVEAVPTPDVTPTPTAEVATPSASVRAPVSVTRPLGVTTAPVEAPATPRRRGRKPISPEVVAMEPERSVKIPETVWDEIRLALVQFPKGKDLPNSIKAYLTAAHQHYQAYLRKHGKLPPAN